MHFSRVKWWCDKICLSSARSVVLQLAKRNYLIADQCAVTRVVFVRNTYNTYYSFLFFLISSGQEVISPCFSPRSHHSQRPINNNQEKEEDEKVWFGLVLPQLNLWTEQPQQTITAAICSHLKICSSSVACKYIMYV